MGIWTADDFTLDVARLHSEIQAIEQSPRLLLKPSELTKQASDNIHNLLHSNGLTSFLYSIAVALTFVLFACLLPVSL